MRTFIVSASLVALWVVFGAAASGFAADIVGCVNNTNGLLRIVSSSSDCRTAESSITLASPATTFTKTLDGNNILTYQTLATLDNGVTVSGACQTTPIPGTPIVETEVSLKLSVATGNNLQASGTRNAGNSDQSGTVFAVNANNSSDHLSFGVNIFQDFDVLARDSTVGEFARIDVHGIRGDRRCTFWGMIIPSS